MKNIFRFWMAVAIICGAVSCAKEDISSSLAGGEVEVTFTANLPELGTRAYADGANATLLRYWVYDASNGQELTALSNQTPAKEKGKFTFTLPLIKGMTYDFVLWADKDGLYNVNDEGIVTVDYTNANNNDRDAFYGFVKGFDPLKSTPKFTLTRPFAQLNAATSENMDDITANGLTLATSSIKAKAYTQFDIKACTVVDSSLEEVELTAEVMPYMAQDENGNPAPNKLPGKETYTYLAMGYLLAPQDGMVSDVTFCFNGKKGGADFTVGGNEGLSYTNVPLKQNYRTNILGQLLTKSTEIEVEINPAFGIPDIEDYEEVAPGLCLINGNTYLITSLEGLKSFATFADGVTRTTIDFKGKTVELAVDIDLENNPWTPINKFDGTFDGQGHTIKNVKIVAENKAYAGFFANAQGTIKNLTLENVDIKGHYKAGAIVGNGLCSRIENCHVLNGTIETSPINKDDGNHAGGITGYLSAENNAWVKDCSVKNVTVIAYRDCGALIGTVNGSKNIAKLEVSGNTVENVIVIANMLPEYVEDKEPNAGEFVGRNIKNVDLTDNTATNVVVEVLKFDEHNTLEFKTAIGFDIIAADVAKDENGYAGKTIEMAADIDFFRGYMSDGDPISTEPIGSTGEYDDRGRLVCKPFKGTFNGKGHTIKNLYQNGYLWKYWFGQYGSIGLFSELESATVKNLVIENFESRVEGGDIAFITGSATGDCVFKDIEIKNSRIATFNNGIGGIIGWSGAGTYTFENIKLDATTTIGGFQQSFDSSVGGIVGQAEPGATYNFENVEINCRLDVYNDVTASWQYYLYRMCGMIIGRCAETTTINGVNYPDLSKYNLSFNNVVVNYGDWMNYHYQVGHGGTKGTGARVEAGFLYDGHSCASDGEAICLPFDQLIGGDQIAVRGLREVNGVTVNYPASYRREVSSAAALTEALGKGVSVVLDADIDFGSTQLAITGENQVVDLGGHALTTANNWGGISLKNGATIKNGTITHAGNTAAIKAFNGCSVENVTINATCTTADKTVTGIAVQQGANIESIKNVTINGVSQGIEVGYQATVGLIENAVVNESNNGTAKGIGLVINGGKVGKAKDCTFKGETYGVTLHLKGVFDAGLELENCTVEGTTASIYAWDEKGISNTSGSLVLTYDAATTLTGPFVWDFEDECQSVVTLNRPQ